MSTGIGGAAGPAGGKMQGEELWSLLAGCGWDAGQAVPTNVKTGGDGPMQRGSASARAAVLVNHRTSKGTGRLAVAAKGREAPARRLVAAGVAAAVARRALDVAALGAADVDRLLLAALLDDVELDLLLLHQRAEARRGDCRLVHKEVVLPAARRDEAKPLLAVEPLDLSDLFALRRLNALGPSARLQVAAAATAAAATVVALDVHAARARDIGGLHLAVLLHRVILDLFALAERAEAVCVDRRLVDEKILTAAVGRDEAEAFCELNHLTVPLSFMLTGGLRRGDAGAVREAARLHYSAAAAARSADYAGLRSGRGGYDGPAPGVTTRGTGARRGGLAG
eukprot:CAMPEP_0185346440 /NCGR_PEP_ID=MMETSP1364-20130426/495_1 /TAXON_ID=38817 /ORGANISM="Gephyrocapsa oceanica, Strain RCC1303" /LENGTH=338 /DNA_ID=CAMNT_0027945729 /DNA_START=117 /DNA_END=1132 /DNA_ORIENTATION=+